jgi:hypothetical protein
MEDGVSEDIAGAAPTVNTEGAEVTGPGFTTVTLKEPAAATRTAGTVAVS